MENYTLSLALFDFLPVILSGFGLYFITKWVSARRSELSAMAVLGSVLIFSGGFFKATWKLIWVIAQVDIDLLEHSLFVLLGSGFLVLASALYQTLKVKPSEVPWKLPISLLTIGMLFVVAGFMSDFNLTIIGIAITTLGNAYFCIRLSAYCIARKQYLPAVFIIGNLLLILGSSAIARTTGQTVDQQWLAEINNTAAQSVFALGAWLVYKRQI